MFKCERILKLFFSSVFADLTYIGDLSSVATNSKLATGERFQSDKFPLVKRFGFSFKKNKLQPGNYRFKISANTTECTSSSETTFTINSAPTAGKGLPHRPHIER